MGHRRLLIVLAVAAVALLTVAAFASEEGKAKTVTFEGEILDMYCFMNHPDTGQGADHAKCATKCIQKGLPIGLMVGDDVYLIIGKDHGSAADLVAEFAGSQSRVTGTVVEHHGVKAFEIVSIEKI
jgi:hypothetical protein